MKGENPKKPSRVIPKAIRLTLNRISQEKKEDSMAKCHCTIGYLIKN